MKTFSPADVVVNFHGFELSGYADGTFVSAKMDNDAFSDVAGADGEVARAASADERGEIVVTVLQTSASNDMLAAEHAKDTLGKTNTGPVFVKDLYGTTKIQGAEAWIKKVADVTLGKDLEAREWTIRVAHMRMNVGGN
jgi:hypothetical protein